MEARTEGCSRAITNTAQHLDASLSSFTPRDSNINGLGEQVDRLTLALTDLGDLSRYIECFNIGVNCSCL